MKKQLTVVCALALLVFAASPGLAINGSIIISADDQGASCQTTLDCQNPGTTTLWVFAVLQGASGIGITGAEYSAAIGPYSTPDEGAGEDLGADAILFVDDYSPANAAGAVVLGSGAFSSPDPLGVRGVNISYPSCQTGDGTKVLLQRVILANCDPGELRLRIIKHDTESNLFFQCPLFTLCDAPTFTKVCVGADPRPCTTPFPPFPVASTCSSSGEFVLNPGPGSDCTIAVAKKTWGQVKGLYSN